MTVLAVGSTLFGVTMKKYLAIFIVFVAIIGSVVWAFEMKTAVFAQQSTHPTNETMAAERETAVSQEVCTGTNLIENPSFEGDYEPYVMPAPGHDDCQTWNDSEPNQYCERVKLATDWHPFWRDTPRTENWENIQPEYVPSLPHEQPPRVRTGEKSQHYFSFWSTHEAGIYQQETAVVGGTYCFSIYGHSWSARTELPGFLSDPNDHGFLYQRVGIDPTGGTDWQSPNIIWSDERMQYDAFGVFQVEATAQASTITVFAYSRPDLPIKHNDVYWDDAHLSLDKFMSVDTQAVGLMADDDNPETLTQEVTVTLAPSLNWTAVLDPSGTFTPTLSQTSGDSNNNTFEITIDTTGLALGTYTTNLTITADSETEGSPFIIPMKVVVAEDVYRTGLPVVKRP